MSAEETQAVETPGAGAETVAAPPEPAGRQLADAARLAAFQALRQPPRTAPRRPDGVRPAARIDLWA